MNVKPLLVLGLGAFALFGFASKSNAAETPALTIDLEAEAAACAKATAEKPAEVDGIAQGDVGQVEWLARVAFWSAYGQWPDIDDPVHVERLAALLTCVSVKLQGGQNPQNPNNPPQLPPVNDTPTPGGYYQIRKGDNPLAVAKAAYKVKAGAASLAAFRRINDDPRNARFRRPIDSLPGLSDKAKETEKKWWQSDTRITFSPRFLGFAAQLADPVDGTFGDGGEYAVIFIPEAV